LTGAVPAWRSINVVIRKHERHWQCRLLDRDAYVMDYWPAGGGKGKEKDLFHALEIATRLAVGADRRSKAACCVMCKI
jgi:hypothetical protein